MKLIEYIGEEEFKNVYDTIKQARIKGNTKKPPELSYGDHIVLMHNGERIEVNPCAVDEVTVRKYANKKCNNCYGTGKIKFASSISNCGISSFSDCKELTCDCAQRKFLRDRDVYKDPLVEGWFEIIWYRQEKAIAYIAKDPKHYTFSSYMDHLCGRFIKVTRDVCMSSKCDISECFWETSEGYYLSPNDCFIVTPTLRQKLYNDFKNDHSIFALDIL